MNFRFFLICLVILFIGISSLVSVSAYRYYTAIHSDDPVTPRLIVDRGEASVIRGETAYDMKEAETLELENGDAIETKALSKATVTWPDKSITRLGENSRIVIEKMYASTDYTHIEIAYDMKRGKVWNTVIRTLLGDSYFEARLPKNNIVAGVRGTTFEVNLDGGYIHAVTHSMRLTDVSGKILTLLPGETVDSENIWVKKGREILDTAWSAYNTLLDTDYQKIRLESVRNRINTLAGKASTWNPLDSMTRWFLSHFAKFRDIKISSLLTSGTLEGLTPDIKNALLPYYQSLGGVGLEKEREVMRGYMQSILTGSLANDLSRQSLWDSLDSSNLMDSLKGNLEKSGQDIDTIRNWIEKEGGNGTKKLLESFSGSLGLGF